MPDKTLIVCDVCDTLYDSNTTFDFIRFYVNRKGGASQIWLSLISSRYSPFFYFLIALGKIFHKDLVRILALQLLSDLDRKKLSDLAFEFHDSFLLKRKNEKVFSLLERLKKEGDVMLLSSSIDPVIGAIAQRNGFSFQSSMLAYQNDISSGKLSQDLTGVKHKQLAEWHKAYRRLTVVTDNHSDYDLVKMADDRYVVLLPAGEEKFWQPLNPNFVKL
ncbi:MAG: haloacid dehalogenase-like hydrolase [Bacteroidetes bacterium]|nr:haloacid dehalogenase-like hydrolase [Bacteroidota bacterium]